MKQQLFLLLSLIFCCLCGYPQEYVAGIKGSQDWNRSELGSVSGYCIMIQNKEDNSVGLQIVAIKDGHFDVETSPLGAYFSDNGVIKITDTTLSSFIVGSKTYNNVHYTKHKAIASGVFTNIELWQLVDKGIEYSIIALAPVKKSQMISDFIAHNLVLLPLPEVTEDSFIESIETVNKMMQKVGGAKMSDELKMTAAAVDKTNKYFIRTYQFYPEVSSEDIEALTTNEATYSMVEYEVENTPLVKNAVALGYTIVIIWKDKYGSEIISYKYRF